MAATAKKASNNKIALLQGTLDMMVMRTLQTGPANGYQIAQALERLSESVLAVEHGTLYPALYRLEKNGWISGEWEMSATNRKARFYRLTKAGKKQLVVETSKWETIAAAISRVMNPT